MHVAPKVIKKYQIEATFQTKHNSIHTLDMTIEAEDGEQVWATIQAEGEMQGEELLNARVWEIEPTTGVAIVIRPKQQALPPPPEPAKEWFEHDAFVEVPCYVWSIPCTYKTEDSDDKVTT